MRCTRRTGSAASSCVPVEATVVCTDGRARVVVVGEVDRCSVSDFAAALAVASTASRGMDVDLSRTTFMDVSGLRALLDAHVRLGRLPEAVVLVDPHPALRWILDLPGLNLVFGLHRSPSPAVWGARSDAAAPATGQGRGPAPIEQS